MTRIQLNETRDLPSVVCNRVGATSLSVALTYICLAKEHLRQAGRRDKDAYTLYRQMIRMENDNREYIYENSSLNGYATGSTEVGSRRMRIDVRKILLGPADAASRQGSISAVMLHEAGHVYFQGLYGDYHNDSNTSDSYARRWENFYRKAVNFCPSPEHGVWPEWGCKP